MKSTKYIAILVIILLTFFTNNNLSGQSISTIDTKFSIAELQNDFKVLRNRYENNLANLYLYVTKERLNKIFDSLYINISPMTGQEFYSYVTQLSSIIKDGHSNIFPSEQTTNFYNQNYSFFPFNIYWIENKMFVRMNLSSDTTIYPGSEILSINKLPVQEIMNYLMDRQVRDGFNESYALWILNNYFREYYSYHFGHPESFSLALKRNDNSTFTVNVSALKKEIINANTKIHYSNNQLNTNSPDNFQFEILNKLNTVKIKIKSWDDKKLISKIDNAFLQIQSDNIDNLILDLRDNQGGNSEPAIHFLSYLLNKPFVYFSELNSVSGQTDSSQILKKERGKMLGNHKVQDKQYDGKLYVLINGGSFSNTAAFCSRIEYNQRGIFIGSETGGNKVVFSGEFGLKKNTILPNTKIICENSNYQMTITDINLNLGRGVSPNYSIIPTIKDYIENKDVVMEKALELVKNSR